MKLNIGENIKQLRREKNMTQDELSELLGVSCQSVSRWENGLCYPDLELLPTISDVFGVTVDKLIGINEAYERMHVAEYLESYKNALSCGNVNECIKIAREGVKEYPNNYELLNKLMEALFISGDEDGNIPDFAENQAKYDSEITALGERIIKHCPDLDIRLEATWRLAFNHCEMGRKEIGRKIFETLPTTDFCRENAMWYGLKDDEKLPYARNQVEVGYDFIMSGIYQIISERLLSDEELLTVCDKRTKLCELIYDGSTPISDWGDARFHCHKAAILARLGRNNEAIAEIKEAVISADNFDARPDSSTVSSLLIGETTTHKNDFETGDSRPLSEILRIKWLASHDFDSIRTNDEFVKIISE